MLPFISNQPCADSMLSKLRAAACHTLVTSGTNVAGGGEIGFTFQSATKSTTPRSFGGRPILHLIVTGADVSCEA